MVLVEEPSRIVEEEEGDDDDDDSAGNAEEFAVVDDPRGRTLSIEDEVSA